jgi:hypothetical protein
VFEIVDPERGRIAEAHGAEMAGDPQPSFVCRFNGGT